MDSMEEEGAGELGAEGRRWFRMGTNLVDRDGDRKDIEEVDWRRDVVEVGGGMRIRDDAEVPG